MAKPETAQLMVRVAPSFIERLDAAIETFGLRSRNQAAADILETYFDFWLELQHGRAQMLARQRDVLTDIPLRKTG